MIAPCDLFVAGAEIAKCMHAALVAWVRLVIAGGQTHRQKAVRVPAAAARARPGGDSVGVAGPQKLSPFELELERRFIITVLRQRQLCDALPSS